MSSSAENSLISNTKSSSSSARTPNISEGHDVEAVLKDLEKLTANGWRLDDSAIGVEKAFFFKSWTKCLDLVSRVGLQSKVKNHHPTIVLTYGTVKIHWTTHRPHGLSKKDTEMAEYCDEQANEIGTSGQKA